jgi:hypothetical protein
MLPDVALLKIFDIYGDDASDFEKRYYEQIEAWHTLVHVCRKWRTVVFGSPLRLNLRLHCRARTPVRKTLDVWPPFPIIVWENDEESWDADNIVAALNHSDRIHKFHLSNIRSSQLKKVLGAMRQPFPALTSLQLHSRDETMPVVPGLLLDALAPRLETLGLSGIPLPGLPKLLLSATHLVSLCLGRIPHFGYFQPEAIVTFLSVLTRLKWLRLEFESPRCHPNRRRLPPRTRTLLPVLTLFQFKGVGEYLEDFVARIDAPLLGYLDITFFHQLIFDTPQLAQFISRTPELKAGDSAHVRFSDQDVSVELYWDGPGIKGIKLGVSCGHSDWQLSSLAQIFNSSFPQAFILVVAHLFIRSNVSPMHWQDVEGNQWLELLHPFTSVKNFHVFSELMPSIAPALQELVREGVAEVLPALQNLFLAGPIPSGPAQEAIAHFVAARELAGNPVGISTWE